MIILWYLIFTIVLVWSAIDPKDYLTWLLEVFPSLIAAFILAIFRFKKIKITNLLYILILIHSIILMIGGHYTYAEVPFFDYLKESLGFERNNYDKVGHFMQGFVPAIAIREFILRKKLIKEDFFVSFFAICFCLSVSALYEIFEWFIAVAIREDSDSFLGTQGYVWDTQSDMLFCFIGSLVSIILLKKYHKKCINYSNYH